MSWKTVLVLLAVSCLLTFGCRRESPAETESAIESGMLENGALIKGRLSDLTIEATVKDWHEAPELTVVITNKGAEPFFYKGAYPAHGNHCFVEIFDRDGNRAARFPEGGAAIVMVKGVWLTIQPGEVKDIVKLPIWAGVPQGTYDVRVGFPALLNLPLAAKGEKYERELVPGGSFVRDLDVEAIETWVPYNPAIGMNKTAFVSREAWDLTLPVANPVYSNVVRFVVPTPSAGDDSAE